MEAILADVREADVLHTYDFVDVVKPQSKIGWQVKSTKHDTPLTWKRAKIANAAQLIADSHRSKEGLQALGDAILTFCNDHASASLEAYNLEHIGYARLIINDKTKKGLYFERVLCSKDNPIIFNLGDFVWHWTQQKAKGKKEQLSSLQGIHVPSGQKWFAWHGQGENQLHFSGEGVWWPQAGDAHSIEFPLPAPSEKLSWEQFVEMLSESDAPD